MRSRIPKLLPLLLLATLAAGCGRRDSAPVASGVSVAVAIPPQAGILRAMDEKGHCGAIAVLIDGTSSPHAFEPSARQLAEIADCMLYASAGLPFESALEERLRAMAPQAAFLPPPYHPDHDDPSGHDDHDDPHWWTSPEGIKAEAVALCGAMKELDPENAGDWDAGCAAFRKRLAECVEGIRRDLGPFRGKAFLAYHPAWGHFAEATGLRQLALEHHGGAPTSKHLVELAGAIRAEGVRAVLVQSDTEAERARSFAEDNGLAIVRVNPLQPDPLRLLEQTCAAVRESLPAARPE